MKKAHNSKPFFALFLGVILLVTTIPPVLALLGLSFSSPIQGGPGTNFVGLVWGDDLLRVDLTALGFAALIVMLTALFNRAGYYRFAALLGLTLGFVGLVDAIQLVHGARLPEGSISFFDELLAGTVLSRLGGAAMIALGTIVIRWGHPTNRTRVLASLAIPATALTAVSWWAMHHFSAAPGLPLLDLNLATLALYGVAALTLHHELRHHRLRFFGHGVLATFIPLTISQLLMTFAVSTVIDDAYHIANILRWFGWLIPAAGLGIDYINTFYAKGISVEMRYLRTVIDTIPHYIFARDVQGRFTLVNQAVADFYGLKVHEIEGRHLMDVHRDVDQCRTWLAEDRETLAMNGKSFLTETVTRRADGQDIWVNSIKTPLKSVLGINDQVLGVSIDISEQRHAEQALAGALEAAKASNKAKSEFLANMSHEIRTPMNCVIGLADLMKDMSPDPQQTQYLDMIRVSGATLLTLINDILDISKIEAGQLELDPVETDLQALVEETVAQIAFTAQAKGLEMVCRLAPGVPSHVVLDPSRLRQVLTNLLNNAAKFTQQGHIYLNIEPVGESEEGIELCFRVADTGIGIEHENLDRIFEKFTQAEAGTTRRFGGTGLGLSISQHLVTLMGGQINVASRVGNGTTFGFTIPVTATAGESAPAAPAGPRHHVLVVTRHSLGGEVLAEQVRSLGHSCRLAIGANEAVEATAPVPGRADWTHVLIDENIVATEAATLQAALRAIPADRRPRLVLLNSLTNVRRREELQELGFGGVLNKPVRLNRLAAALDPSPVADTPDEALIAPAEAADTPAAAPAIASVAAAPAASADEDEAAGEGPRVLLAEDNPFNQKVAVAMLRMLGCRVDVAGTGVQTVDLARRHHYDLVLMDCQMPVMDGYEATRRIRQLPPPGRDVTIIAMTANALSGDRKACFAAGMNDFLSKPITRDMLRAMLEQWDVLQNEPTVVGE